MAARKTSKNIYREIDLKLIDRPDDICRIEVRAEELQELVDSIRERGLMQPIGVSPRGDRFLIVFGDRRFLAHEILKRKKIMCHVQEREETQVIIDRAVENIQRVNLTPFEEGHIYKGLMDKGGLTIAAICEMTSKSAGVIQRRVDIFRMPDSFQKAIHAGTISLTVAEEFWSCPDAARREYFLEMAIDHGVTKAVARNWVDEFKKEQRTGKQSSEGGGGAGSVLPDAPIYRGCDVCRNPVEYKDVKELRLCPGCHKGILDVALEKN